MEEKRRENEVRRNARERERERLIMASQFIYPETKRQ